MGSERDAKSRRKIRAILVFEAVMFTYLAGTAIVQALIVHFTR
jgi:hypothetical protein